MFKPAPEFVDREITFNLNERALSTWLNKLPIADDFATCDAIFNLLQSLNELGLSAEKRIQFSAKIQTHIVIAAERLEASYLDSRFPLAKAETNNVELIVWLHFELARSYLLAINNMSVKVKKRPLAESIYHALSCLNQAFVYMCEVYTQPFAGFWQMCYELYGKAEKFKLRHIEINASKHTIQNVFNHILVLELCGTNQFRSRHIKRISQSLDKYLEYTKVTSSVEKKYLQSYCKFDLSDDTPPRRMHESGYSKDKSSRFITTVIVAKKMFTDLKRDSQNSDAPNSIQQKLLLQVVNSLGMAQQRKNTRVKKDKACTGVIGLDNLVYLLRKEGPNQDQVNDTPISTEAKIMSKPDPRVAGQWEIPDLELVPFGEEQTHQLRETYKTKIWHNKKLDKLFSAYKEETKTSTFEMPVVKEKKQVEREQEISFQGFEILDSSAKGHRVACNSDQIKVKTGDVLGMVPDFTGRIELGLVCRLNNSYDEGISLGIKILSLEAKLAKITQLSEKGKSVWSLFLPGTKSIQPIDCVVFNSSHFKSGDIIKLSMEGKEMRRQLGKLLHSTASISHLELLPPK